MLFRSGQGAAGGQHRQQMWFYPAVPGAGSVVAGDIETLLGLVGFLGPGKTFCAHAPGAVEPLGSAIKYFRPEFEAGIAQATPGVPPLARPIVIGA